MPRPPGPWCRKKAVIRSEPNDGAYGFANQRTAVRRTAVRRGGFRDADNEATMGDGPGASVALQRPRTAMARSAPPWTSSLANRQKKGAYILNLTGGNPALASVGTNVTQRPMTGKPLFGDRIAAKTGAAAAGEPARQAKYVSPKKRELYTCLPRSRIHPSVEFCASAAFM